jgi:hypothetical protein
MRPRFAVHSFPYCFVSQIINILSTPSVEKNLSAFFLSFAQEHFISLPLLTKNNKKTTNSQTLKTLKR